MVSLTSGNVKLILLLSEPFDQIFDSLYSELKVFFKKGLVYNKEHTHTHTHMTAIIVGL